MEEVTNEVRVLGSHKRPECMMMIRPYASWPDHGLPVLGMRALEEGEMKDKGRSGRPWMYARHLL